MPRGNIIDHRPDNGFVYILTALFIAAGLGLAGYFVSKTIYNANIAINTATVKGLAERSVTADSARWQIGFTLKESSKDNIDLKSFYQRAENDRNHVIKFLKDNDIKTDEIAISPIGYYASDFRNSQNILVEKIHTISGQIIVNTNDVHKIEKVRGKASRLIAEGLNIQNTPPAYRFSKLNDIKPAMLKEATQNARIAASEFAKNAGTKVGRIKTAQQGRFVIRDRGEEYGDSAKINKTVRVITTISFYLDD